MTQEQDAMNRLVDVVERWLELMVGNEDDGPKYAQCLFSIDYVSSRYRYGSPAIQGAMNDWEEIQQLLTSMSNLLAVLRPDGPRYWTYNDEEWEGRPTSCRIDPDAQLRVIAHRQREHGVPCRWNCRQCNDSSGPRGLSPYAYDPPKPSIIR